MRLRAPLLLHRPIPTPAMTQKGVFQQRPEDSAEDTLSLKPPDRPARRLRVVQPPNRIERRDRLGGLIHEYGLAE